LLCGVVSHVSLTTELGGTTVQVGIVNRLTEGLALGPKVMFMTSKPELCFVNVTDNNIILQSGQEIATVEEAQVLCAETESKALKHRVSKKTDTIPKHTEELLRSEIEG
jgi:hypothetical protein